MELAVGEEEDLMRTGLMDGRTTNIAGLFAGTNSINRDAIRLQRLEWDHHLVIFHVIPAEQQDTHRPLGLGIRHRCLLFVPHSPHHFLIHNPKPALSSS